MGRFVLVIDGEEGVLQVARLSGHEALSELFQFELVAASEDPAIDPAAVVGKAALLTINADTPDVRYVHGMIARFQQGDAGKKVTLYQVTLVPKVWKLLQRSDCRIFQDKSAPEIVTDVLNGAGLSTSDYRWSLRGTYPKREYCVQYRESDWAFVSRLLEDVGIVHFFEHSDGGHVLVMGDSPAAHTAVSGNATVPFAPQMGALGGGEYVTRVRYGEWMLSGKLELRDWYFATPTLKLEGAASGSAFTDLGLYDHPGGYRDIAEGKARARLRLEERNSQRKVALGASSSARFVPGATFTMSDHPREALNREWLLCRIHHRGFEPLLAESGDGEEGYDNEFEAIPSDVPFRPPLVTPRPTIKGVQSAIVVGPAGEEIHVDEHGRVKVQFHWDRLGKEDDKSSCWLRVAQGMAGEGWGALFLPRIGHEVLVHFFDGDPDRPIVAGSVYHGANVPPYPLPAHKTVTTIKSNSTPGGGGSNELRFEDKKGSEEIYLHGQKDWTIAVENDENATIGHDQTRKVTNDRALEVGNNQSEKIGKDEVVEIGNDRRSTVGHDENASVGHDRVESVGNDHTESIGGNAAISVSKAKTEEVGDDSSESVGKNKKVSAGKDYSIAVSGSMSTKVGSDQRIEVELKRELVVGEKITITCGDTKVTIAKNGDVKVEGGKLDVKATGDVKLESQGKVELKASGDVKIESTGKVEVKGSGPVDVNASGAVKLKGTSVGIN